MGNGLLSESSVTVALANGNVCCGHKLPNEMRPIVFDLCFDTVDKTTAQKAASLNNYGVVRRVVSACSLAKTSRQIRCIPRLQESLRPLGSCRRPVHLMASLEAVNAEIDKCFVSNLQDHDQT